MRDLQEQQEPSIEDLEDLLVNNRDLEKIDAFLSKFNPIRIMRVDRKELLHSAILAWLLDPRETHALGDRFLKAFLGEAFRGNSSLGSPTALEISQSDLRDTEVRREWENMDIVLRSPANQWAIVVENKYDSRQSEGQLAKYMAKMKTLFDPDKKGLNMRGIFLTLHDEEPQDQTYAPIGYDAVCDILAEFLQDGMILSAEVAVFVKHYIEILEEALGVSQEHLDMEKLARELYRNHAKALNFIVEYGRETDFERAIATLVGEDVDFHQPVSIEGEKYHVGWIGNNALSFAPHSWYVALGRDQYSWAGCSGWWMEWPLSLRVELLSDSEGMKGQVVLVAEVGPIADHKFRSELIEAIQHAADACGSKRIKFIKGAADQGRKFSRFFKNNSVKLDDLHQSEAITDATKKLLRDFQPELKAIGEILKPFQKYGE